MRILLFTMLLFQVLPQLNAQKVVIVSENLTSKVLQKQEVFFLKDTSKKLTLQDIIQPRYQRKFKAIPKRNSNFGYQTATFWLKIRIKTNRQTPKLKYLLEIAYANLDSVFLFSPKGRQWKIEITGDHVPFSKRKFDYRHFLFSLDLVHQKPRTFYLKVRSKGSILVPLILHTPEAFRVQSTHQELFYGFFFGVLFIMIFYNLFVYFSLRDGSYLLYCIWLILTIIIQAMLSGHANQYLWGEQVDWANYGLIFFIGLSNSTALLFSMHFLKLSRAHQVPYIASSVFIILSLGLAIASFFVDYNVAIRFTVLLVMVTALAMLIIGINSWMKGNTSARFFVWAILAYHTSNFLVPLRNLGVFPDVFLSRYGVQIGAMLEVALLSFALADRINIYRKSAKEAQEAALSQSLENEKIIKEQNEVLEQKVQERTHKLNDANQELVASEEELRQNMEELQAIQETLQIQSRKLAFQHKNIQSSIKAALSIQQAILPYKDKLDTLLKDYFVIYKPKDVVSGDFYWLNKIENKTILACVDCTGHGVPGAFMSLIGNTLLDKIVRVWHILNPAEILSKLHEDIQIMLRQKETRNNGGMEMSVIVWEALPNQKIQVRFAGAKHALYYITPQDSQIKQIKGDRQFIGGLQKAHKIFTVHDLELNAGTTLYCGTDGFADQNNLQRKRIGRDLLLDTILANAHLPLSLQKNALENLLSGHMGDASQRDDILWMGIKL